MVALWEEAHLAAAEPLVEVEVSMRAGQEEPEAEVLLGLLEAA